MDPVTSPPTSPSQNAQASVQYINPPQVIAQPTSSTAASSIALSDLPNLANPWPGLVVDSRDGPPTPKIYDVRGGHDYGTLPIDSREPRIDPRGELNGSSYERDYR